MSEGATASKTCIACGTDCAGKPRTKDGQGRYMCKPCFEAKSAKAAAKPAPKAPAPRAAPVTDTIPIEDDGVLASLLESEPSAASPSMTPCPSCGAGLMAGAVICTTCGHDLRTGKGMKSKVQKERGEGAEKALAVAGAVAGVPMVLTIGCVCAAIGGGLGAGLWAFISYQANLEVGWIAWIIGVLAGVGMMAGARAHAGFLTGALAAGIAVLCVAGGKYAAVSVLVDHHLKKVPSARVLANDEYATAMIARDVVVEFKQSGKKVEWPQGEVPDGPTSETEFPAPVWTEAQSRWQKMDAERQSQMKTDLAADIAEKMDEIRAFAKEEIFKASFSLYDILWFFLAVGSAFKIGSGLSSDD